MQPHTIQTAWFAAAISVAFVLFAVWSAAQDGWLPFAGIVASFLAGGSLSKVRVEHHYGLMRE